MAPSDSKDSIELGPDAAPTSTPATIDDFPDGGLRAWLVVLGASCATLSTFGLINSFGVFQNYYEETLLHDVSPSDIAWIGSLQYALVFLPGLVTGRLFDIGYFRLPVFAASVLLIVSTFLVAQCTRYWHFVLCQGIAVGLACGFIFCPCMSVLGHWFRRKRGVALGIVATGSSVGGTIYPIATRRLINEVGFPWTMRILGFILIVTLTVINLTLKRRIPPGKNITGGLFNLRAFKSAPFSVYSAACFFAFLGLYTLLIYLEVSAVSVGVSEDFAFYLISIANASSLFGRVTAAAITDRVGPVNVVAPMSLVAAVVTFAWPFARNEKSLIAIAVVYGYSSAAFVSSFLMPLYGLGEISDLGRRIGMGMSISAIGALAGPPISGAINNASGGFELVGYFAGSAVIVAVVLMLLTRYLVLKKMYGKF